MYWTIARSGTHDVVGLSHGVWNSISDLGPPPTLDGLELDQFAGTVTQRGTTAMVEVTLRIHEKSPYTNWRRRWRPVTWCSWA